MKKIVQMDLAQGQSLILCLGGLGDASEAAGPAAAVVAGIVVDDAAAVVAAGRHAVPSVDHLVWMEEV
jgi:hypothetical protein